MNVCEFQNTKQLNVMFCRISGNCNNKKKTKFQKKKKDIKFAVPASLKDRHFIAI